MLDSRDEIAKCPVIDGYVLSQVDGHSIEVVVEKSQSINELFTALTDQGIYIVSMRNKANRLEELFLDLVEQNLQEKANG